MALAADHPPPHHRLLPLPLLVPYRLEFRWNSVYPSVVAANRPSQALAIHLFLTLYLEVHLI